MAEYIRVEGTALEILAILNNVSSTRYSNTFEINQSRYGYCCDTGNYSYSSTDYDLLWVYWCIVNYATSQYHRFEIEYVSESPTHVFEPIYVSIIDDDMPEHSTTRFEIIGSPKR